MLQRAAVLIFLSLMIHAQPVYFGSRVPLTNTRYGAADAAPLFVSQSLVIWSAAHNVRVSSVATNDVAVDVLASNGDADVLWTGERFLVAASSGANIIGRWLDPNGVPAGPPFTIVENASMPRLAGDLVFYRDANGVHARAIDDAEAAPARIADDANDFDVAGSLVLIDGDDGLHVLSLTDGAKAKIADDAERVSLATDGRDYLALWTSGGELHAAAIRANGVAEESSVLDGDVTAHAALWDGTTYHAAYVANGVPRVVALDGASRVAELAPMIGAAEQTLAATASTSNAALVVWNETGDARIGVRSRGGAWRERLLVDGERAIAASSDGRDFVVITENDDGWIATTLDETGATIRTSSRVAFDARAIAGNIVVGTRGNDVVAAKIGGATNVIRTNATDPAIAYDGSHALAVFETPDRRVEAVRLDATANRVEPDILIWEDAAGDPAVAFDGDRYVVVFASRGFIKGRRVTRDGVAVLEAMQTGRVGGADPQSLALTNLGDRMGLTWFDGRAQALVLHNGWTVETTKNFSARSGAAARFVALPEGRGLVQSEVHDGIPYFGGARLTLSMASESAEALVPQAPRIAVTQNAGLLHVNWSAVPHATGYRLEYRIGESQWIEAEGWTSANATTLAPTRGGTYSLRLRAWSDGGVSAYSDPVTISVTTGKRRAVR